MKTPVKQNFAFFIALAAMLFTGLFSFAQTSIKPAASRGFKIIPFERKAFIENKHQFDQLLPQDKQDFKFCIDKGQQVLFFADGLCFRFTKYKKTRLALFGIFKSEQERELQQRSLQTTNQYIGMKWLNCNPNATIIAEEKQSTQFTYNVKNDDGVFTNIACEGYSRITYKELYPGIDVEYVFHPEKGFKYNILVHAGADISNIKMQYDAGTRLSIKNGNLYIKTICGDIVDHAPLSFYTDSRSELPSSFTLENNVVSFALAPGSSGQDITIDPWTLVPGFTPAQAYDNGVDNTGNVYVYGGGQGAYIVEKYPPGGGAAIWSLANSGVDQAYYGDMLVENSGNFYLSEGFVASGGHTYKYSPTSAPIWQSTIDGSYQEHWRLALNCITSKVIVAGGGTTSPTLNIAEIDVNTGVLINAKSNNPTHEDMAGLCVDDAGKSYMIGANSNSVYFTDNANNTLAIVANGYNMSEIGVFGTPSFYPAGAANGYNCMALGGSSFLFTSDGAELKKWDINTQALVSSVAIPGGQQNMGNGLLADGCNNIFVGSINGVYRYDFNLVQKEFQATTAAVYDIAYAINSDIVASGDGFVQTLPFGRESCGAANIIVTTDPCNAAVNTVSVTPTQGVPPFSFFWDDGNTDSVRTNLSLGDHIVSIKDGSCTPSFFSDTVTIGGASTAIAIVKNNPLCVGGTDGDITVTLLSNQQITGVTWTPTVTNSLLNDSTTKATGLTSGTYNCFVTSDLGCSFDTTITLIAQSPNPSADFTALQACEDQPIAFNDNSTSAIGNINAWSWNFGDSPANVTTQNTNHTYTDSGTFNATLIVTTAAGCRDTIQKQIIIHPLPSADFTFNNVCEGAVAFFSDLSTVNPPDVVQIWTWDFGDGAPFKNNQNTSHLYPATGPYSVELTVTSNFGCKDSVTKTFTVNPVPVVSFTSADTNGCSIFCANMQSNVNLAGGNVAAYAWDYGVPGATGNTANGSYCYSNSTSNDAVPVQQEFDVSLTVTSDSGCVSTVSKNNYIVVYPNPIAEFSVDAQVVSIVNPGITITNTSHGESTWFWNFGDSLTDIISDPLPHVYADTGTYTIKLNIANQYGCLDSTTRVVIIEPDWAFFVPNAFTPNSDNINDVFSGSGYGFIEYQMIIFDRWGNKIYATDNYDKPWDGTANEGKEAAQMDVYVYQINVKDPKRVKHTYMGTVTLVR